jgi:hypothetical protein
MAAGKYSGRETNGQIIASSIVCRNISTVIYLFKNSNQ